MNMNFLLAGVVPGDEIDRHGGAFCPAAWPDDALIGRRRSSTPLPGLLFEKAACASQGSSCGAVAASGGNACALHHLLGVARDPGELKEPMSPESSQSGHGHFVDPSQGGDSDVSHSPASLLMYLQQLSAAMPFLLTDLSIPQRRERDAYVSSPRS